MTDRQDEINEFVDNVLKLSNAEGTPENRLAALEGLKTSWEEDEEHSIEKSFYMLTLTLMIMSERTKVQR